MANITSLIVKIGAQDAEITAALAKLGTNVKRTESEFKKLGSTPVAQQAQQSLKTLDDTVKQITNSQQRLADRAKIAAAGLTAIGGPARVTKNELEQINRTIQNGLDAYRALGQQAPKELQKVADAVAKQRKELAGSGGGGLGKVGDLLGGLGIGTGLLTSAGIVGGLGAGAKAALDYADSLTKLADRTGISITALQRLGAIADASGNNVEQVASAVNAMQKRIAEGADGTTEALNQIGLSVAQLKSLSPDEQFIAIAKGVQSIKDPADQTRIAMELFGKSGAELLPTLKANVEDLADSTFKMSEDSVKALDDFGDGLGRLKTSGVNVLGELAASAIALVSSLAQFPEVLRKAQEAAAKRAPGERAPNVSIPGMIGQVPGNLPAGVTPAQLQALIRGETAVAPAAPKAPQLAGLSASVIDATRALDLLNGGLDEQVKKATEATAAAQRASDAHKKWAANFAEVTEKARGFSAVVDTIDGSVVEGVKYYVDRGVAIGKVGEIYGLTAVQVDALGAQFVFENQLATASAAIHAKLATEVYNVDTAFGKLAGRPLSKIPALQAGPNAQLAGLGQPFAQGLRDTLTTDLPRSIMAAIQGGGSVIQSAGSTLGSFLVSDKGFGKALTSGLTSIFGSGIGTAINSLLPGLGALVGPLLGKLAGLLKGIGGPSKQERAGREVEAAFEGQFKSFDDMVNRIGDAFAATGRSREDAQAAVKEMLDAEKQGADAVTAVITRLQGVLDESAATLAETGRAQQAADAIAAAASTKRFQQAQDQLQGLITKRDQLFAQVANEAPEQVMGVIEAQQRGQLAVLDDEIENKANQYEELAKSTGQQMADAIVEALSRIRVTLPVGLDLSGIPREFFPGEVPEVDGAATGGLVTASGIQRFAAGGRVLPFLKRGTDTVPAMLTPGEIVLNAAQQGRVAGAISGGGGESISGDVVMVCDGAVIGRIARADVLKGGKAMREMRAILKAAS